MSIASNQLRIARELWSRLQPVDRAVPTRLQSLLSDRRFGSRDRRLYRELLFTALRQARVLSSLAPDDEAGWAARVAVGCAPTRETEAFRLAHAASGAHEVAPLDLVPEWFAAECDVGLSPGAAAAALLSRAPVWVRLQSDDAAEAEAEWAARCWVAGAHPPMPEARRLPAETNVSACTSYQAGHYEVQDLGSQAILASLGLPGASPGPRWLDACAGAGGKTLQLARLLGREARIDATDVRPAALAELRARAERAGLASRIRTLSGPAASLYDGVLVDAPCSGSGTWRRAPHLMACTAAADLAAAARLQSAILREAAARVRPGGLLVYATCSIARTENRSVAERFLAGETGAAFTAEPIPRDFGFPRVGAGLAIAPGVHDNDGFYVVVFRRKK